MSATFHNLRRRLAAAKAAEEAKAAEAAKAETKAPQEQPKKRTKK